MIIKDEEIFFIETDNNKTLIYLPLRSYLGIIKNKNKTKLLSGEPLFFDKIKKRKLIDIQELHNYVSKGAPSLSIAITDNCNIGCLYCHHSAGDIGRVNSIDLKLAYDAIDNYFDKNSAAKEVRITFMGGGEPTADIYTLKNVISHANKMAANKNIKVSYRMATNGCFSNTIAEYILNNFSEISLSFDGPEYIQNLQRPFKNGSGTFKDVYRTAKYLYNNKFPFAFRSTISDFSMKHLEDIIDFFSTEFPGKSVGLEPLNPYGRAERQNILKPPDRIEFAKKLIEAFEYSKNKNIHILSAGLGKFETLRTIFCGAVGIPNYTILTNGIISCCTRDNVPDEFNYGRFDSEKKCMVIDDKKVENIRKMNVFNYKECQDCFCKYHCAGDCPDLRLSGLVNCEANRILGKYFLEQKMIREGGE